MGWIRISSLMPSLPVSKAPIQMMKYGAVHALAGRWGEIDPQAALAFGQSRGNLGERIQIISGVVSGWAENDPTAAIAWAKQLPPGQTRNQALTAIASTVGAQDPHAVIALMSDGPRGPVTPRI